MTVWLVYQSLAFEAVKVIVAEPTICWWLLNKQKESLICLPVALAPVQLITRWSSAIPLVQMVRMSYSEYAEETGSSCFLSHLLFFFIFKTIAYWACTSTGWAKHCPPPGVFPVSINDINGITGKVKGEWLTINVFQTWFTLILN